MRSQIGAIEHLDFVGGMNGIFDAACGLAVDEDSLGLDHSAQGGALGGGVVLDQPVHQEHWLWKVRVDGPKGKGIARG